MSKGDQIRDFISLDETSKFFIKILSLNVSGVFNCSSGDPITVKDFIKNYIRKKKYNIKLDLGKYPYNPYEPFKFWGKKEII